MDEFLRYWPIALIGVAVAVFVYRYAKAESVKGVFFGGKIDRTLGQATGANSLGFATLVTVHTLDSSDPNRAIALEMATKVAASLRWTPLTLSRVQALELAKLLTEAAVPSNNSFKPNPLR